MLAPDNADTGSVDDDRFRTRLPPVGAIGIATWEQSAAPAPEAPVAANAIVSSRRA
jgi:hypothetical protein